MRIPIDFNPEKYLELHPDVAAAGLLAEEHYLTYGIYEGRAYKAPADERSSCLHNLELSGKSVLEIGPLDRPLVSQETVDVIYADHCSVEELREKYAADPHVTLQDICNIHVDLSKINLCDAGRFDVVVASHVIEHVPDLIKWLKDLGAITTPGGVVALVVPDKRYTFDIFRRETEEWMIEEAHSEQRWRPSLRQVADHFSNVVSMTPGVAVRTKGLNERYLDQDQKFEKLLNKFQLGHYVDTHCWVFRSDTFRRLIGQVLTNNDIPFVIETCTQTKEGTIEFYVQLLRR